MTTTTLGAPRAVPDARRGPVAPTVRLVGPAPTRTDRPLHPDPAQRRVVEHPGGPLLVLAGPGTGKTATVVEAVAARVDAGVSPEQVLVLTFSRRAAAELRDRLSARLGTTTTEPLARTFHSYAFGLLRRDAVRRARPEPRLLTAAEVVADLRDLLAGRRGDASVPTGVHWPSTLARAVPTAGFATEVADLLARAAERGLDPEDLADLAVRVGREDWAAAADLAAEYEDSATLTGIAARPPAVLVREAVQLLRDDPQLLATERAARRLVVVDEFQDCDPAQVDLLELVAGGSDLVAVGDQDQAIYAFRGADRTVVDEFPTRFATPAGPAPVLALDTCRRSGRALLATSRRIAASLPGPVEHRLLVPSPDLPDGRVQLALHPSPAAERGWIAGRLRAARLRDGVEWSGMAVLVRTGAELAPLRRALRAAEVPVTAASDPVPVANRPAARDLLALARLVLGTEPDADTVEDLLTGPYAGLDVVAVRVLRAALVAGTAGDPTGSSAVLVRAFTDPAGEEAAQVRGAAARVGPVLDALAAGRTVAADGSVEPGDLLWTVWSATGSATRWRNRALRGGRDGAAADRDLDAVVALFDAVERYAEDHLGAGARDFLDAMAARALPEAAAPAGHAGAVSVMTAHAAKGLQWPVVVVAGVQEDTWPGRRVRSGLLGQRDLVRLLDADRSRRGPRQQDVVAAPGGRGTGAAAEAVERGEVLAEERRLFYVACTRASRLLVVTAVQDRDTRPSRFFTELARPSGHAAGGARPDPPGTVEVLRYPELADHALDPSALVAHLRQVLCAEGAPGTARGRAAARQLARLAEAGVAGADPARWWGRVQLSDARPAVEPQAEVTMSPSAVAGLESCPLQWFLTSTGGRVATSAQQQVGLLVHALSEEVARGTTGVADLLVRFDEVLPTLGLGDGWVDRREASRLRRVVESLQAWWVAERAAGREVVAVEEDLSVRFDSAAGPLVLRGRADLVDRLPGGAERIVDFKTGKTTKKPDEVAGDPQLASYQTARARQTGSPTEAAVLVYVGHHRSGGLPKVLDQPGTGTDGPEWFGQVVSVANDVVRASAYPARPNDGCPRCAVRSSCPAQQAGGQVTP